MGEDLLMTFLILILSVIILIRWIYVKKKKIRKKILDILDKIGCC